MLYINSYMGKKYSKEALIEKFIEINGTEHYDYSKFRISDEDDTIGIFYCNKIGKDNKPHGYFKQSIYGHLAGKGCKQCAMEELWNKQYIKSVEKAKEYINKSKIKFNDKFDYGKIFDDFKGVKYNSTIHCNVHDIDFQVPLSQHLNSKYGCCPLCSNEAKSESKRKGIDYFVNKFSEIYNNKYDYSSFIKKGSYKNHYDIIEPICPIHGKFKVNIKSHLKGTECPECTKERIRQNRLLPFEEFVKRANIIHKGKYKYFDYKGQFEDATIWCSEKFPNGESHGFFKQMAHNHLAGEGCPKCRNSKLENSIMELLIENNINFEHYKNFIWLKKQSLDIYLPNYNIAIECQGTQHFEPVDFGGNGIEEALILFEKNKERDRRKKRLCQENNVTLVYYLDKKFEKYLNPDEDIYFTDKEELLRFILFKPKIIKEDLNNEASNKT